MPFLALPQLVVYDLPYLIPFPCVPAPGEKGGKGGGKRKEKKEGKKKKFVAAIATAAAN